LYGSRRSGRLGLVCRSGGLLIAALAIALLGLLGALLGLAACEGGVAFLGTFAKELDVLHYNLCGIAVLAVIVCVFAGTETAFYIDLGALADKAFDNIGRVSPGNDVVPFGVFPLLAVAVTVTFRGCKGEPCHLGVCAWILGIVFKVTYFGVFANVTDKHYFIQ